MRRRKTRTIKHKKNTINVVVRCRPLFESEKSRNGKVKYLLNRKSIITQKKNNFGHQTTYEFDRVYGPTSTQEEIFNTSASKIVDSVLCGFNATIFAYGQTSTGKTYTMEGVTGEGGDMSKAGVIPRSLDYITTKLKELQKEFVMKISCIELYNEILTDLISGKTGLKIYAKENGSNVSVRDVKELTVTKTMDVNRLLRDLSEKKQVATTKMNNQSSRSHVITTITVHIKDTDKESFKPFIKTGKLNLVDLAGSENIQRSGGDENETRKLECSNINKSLLVLGRVITALGEKSSYVPFRSSKLTRLLQDSLGGRQKTCIIATMTTAAKYVEDTLSTLEYAQKAKEIENTPTQNVMVTTSKKFVELSQEINDLKEQLSHQREKNGVYLKPKVYHALLQKQERLAELEKNMSFIEEDYKQKIEEMAKKMAEGKEKVRQNEFLIKEKERNEKRLCKVVDELKEKLEQRQKDVEKLDVLYKQKKEAEDENKRKMENYAQLFKVDQESIGMLLGDFQTSHEKFCGDLKLHLESSLKNNCDQFTKMKENAGIMFNMFDTQMKELGLVVQNFNSQFLSSTCLPIMENVNKNFVDMNTQFKDYVDNQHKGNMEILKYVQNEVLDDDSVKNFAQSTKEIVKGIFNRIDNNLQLTQDEYTKFKENRRQSFMIKTEKLKNMINTMQKSYNRSYDEHSGATKKSWAKTMEEKNSDYDDLSTFVNQFEENHEKEVAKKKETLGERQMDFQLESNTARGRVEGEIRKMETKNNQLREEFNVVMENTEEFTNDMMQGLQVTDQAMEQKKQNFDLMESFQQRNEMKIQSNQLSLEKYKGEDKKMENVMELSNQETEKFGNLDLIFQHTPYEPQDIDMNIPEYSIAEREDLMKKYEPTSTSGNKQKPTPVAEKEVMEKSKSEKLKSKTPTVGSRKPKTKRNSVLPNNKPRDILSPAKVNVMERKREKVLGKRKRKTSTSSTSSTESHSSTSSANVYEFKYPKKRRKISKSAKKKKKGKKTPLKRKKTPLKKFILT